jgi:hypothetical protein
MSSNARAIAFYVMRATPVAFVLTILALAAALAAQA